MAEPFSHGGINSSSSLPETELSLKKSVSLLNSHKHTQADNSPILSPSGFSWCDERLPIPRRKELDLSNSTPTQSDIIELIRRSHNELEKLNLSGCGLGTLPQDLKDCHNLEELNLSNNSLCHSDISSLKYIPWHKLKRLDLSACDLTELPEGLKNCDKLEELNLTNNPLSHSDISSLKYIRWHKLQNLNLSGCGLRTLPKDLKDCDKLEELNLSNNPLNHAAVSTLIRRSRNELKKLSLSGCGLRKLPEDLEDCHKLEELNLSNNPLRHSDTSSLKNIPWHRLEKLDLSGCDLRTLPENLEDCHKLEELNLSNNPLNHSTISTLIRRSRNELKRLGLSACDLTELPKDLQDCQKLEELNLSNNPLSQSAIFHLIRMCQNYLKKLNLSGCGLRNLPKDLNGCKPLEELNLSDNPLSQSAVSNLLRMFQNYLKKLNLSGCGLGMLPEEFKDCHELEELNLSNNPLNQRDISSLKYIPWHQLKRLDLSNCCLAELPEDLEDSHKLEELNLSNNPLSNSDISSSKYIPWHKLKRLDLSGCCLTKLPENLEDCHKLEELNLSNNLLSQSAIVTLIRRSRNELKKLSLSGCGLTKLPEDLEDCHKLEELSLSNNPLSHSDISPLKYIPWHQLKRLDLSACDLTKLPEGLKDCDKLEELNLSNNCLSRSDLSSLKYIHWCRLEKLDLSGCGLTELPKGLEDCHKLEELNVSNNHLSHSDMSSLKYIPWHQFKRLNLSACGLTELPEGPKNCDKLQELNLSNNYSLRQSTISTLTRRSQNELKKLNLSGCDLTKLPKDLEDCHKLEELNLSNNLLSQSTISTLTRRSQNELKKLNLSGIGLTKLPKDLENCHKLEELNLSNNRLSQTDISSLKYIPWHKLKRLDLSACDLTKLPRVLEHYDKLEELNLSNNPLSQAHTSSLDYIPWHQLKTLDLSACNLTELPEDYKYCHKLEELNLSSNPLSCSDMSSLVYGSLHQLKRLDLSACGLTKFHCRLRDCDKLEELNLSNNPRLGQSFGYSFMYNIPREQLKKLNLSGCRIEQLCKELNDCHQLEELNLSKNPLYHSFLPSLEYIPWQKLRRLDLSFCGLTKLPKSLKNYDKLEELNLSNNFPLSKTDISSSIRTSQNHLRKLNLSGCGLDHIVQPMLSSLEMNQLTKIVFTDAVYTQVNKAWKVELRYKVTESPEEKNKDETDNKDPVSDVPENSVSGIKASRQPCSNSITIGEEGGYFRVPIASAFLLFPPKAVEGEVTLTCSRVKYKEFAKPRDGELFVSRILKVEPENVTFKKPVTVLLSHSAYEDQVFFDFYELIVEDLSPNGWKELKTEMISSVEDIPKEICNPEIFDNYLPVAKATIRETCTLVAATRVKSDQILVPIDCSYTFSQKYGENAELKITFPAGVTEEILPLKVQLFPADDVFNKDVHLDKNHVVRAPVIRVSGQTAPFLIAVDVQLTYSSDDVLNIIEEFLPVGNAIKFTTEYGLLLHSRKDAESKTKWENLNENNDVYIERPRKDQLKFSFSVKHFCDIQPVVKESSDSVVPQSVDEEVNIERAARYSAFVWAVHKTGSVPKRLYAVLAPKNRKGDLKGEWQSDGVHLMCRVRDEEPIYFCVPLTDSDHLPLENYTLRFDPDDESELPNNTSDNVDLRGKDMRFLKNRECINGENHTTQGDCRAVVPVYIFGTRTAQNTKAVSEPSPTIATKPENGISSNRRVVHNGHATSQKKVMREYKRLCEVFEKAIEDGFLNKLGINKDDIQNPDMGVITKALNDAGTVTSIILGLGVGATIALSIGSYGVGSIVGATVAGITFTVSKVDKKMKKSKAKIRDKKVEIYFHSHLKCIIMDVAKELSRMFEYQVLELKDGAQIDTLAECAVDLMLDLKEHDTFDRNTLIKKILQDGRMKKKALLTRDGDEWSAPDVFRKPGLQRTILGTVGAEFIYQVKPNGACDTRKYGYRGQFLELKKYGRKFEEDEKIPEMRYRKNPATDETSTREDPCEELCNECSFNYENCTSGKYFSESDIDAQYKETREERSTYHPIHILVQCSKVLETFIGNPLEEEKPSLANFLKKKLSLPENHVVHPVYRQHSPGKVPDLQKSDLTGSDFSHSDFTNSSLKECHFSKCVMLFVNLEEAKISGSKFCDTLISHSNLQNVEADDCEWTKTSLCCSNADGACLPSIGGNFLGGTNISDATIGKERKLNCNETFKCERTNTLRCSNADSGAFLDTGEPRTSGNLLDRTNRCDASSETRRKITHKVVTSV